MNRRHFRFLAIVFACVIFLTGCGTPLHEMTDEEREVIVHSAAYLIAKHNIRQTDGLSSIKPTEEALAASEEDTEVSEANIPENDYEYITYAAAIGQEKTEVIYNGMVVDDIYTEKEYYMLTPKQGKKYAILNFTLRNPYVDSIDIDAYTTGPVFYANFGDGNYIGQEKTFLTYSLPTYTGTLGPGQTQDVVLLFQIDEETAESAKLTSMLVEVDGVKYNINL